MPISLTNQALEALIKKQKYESFQNPDQHEDSDALGLLISHYFEWDGLRILETFYSALEDANFHTECVEVQRMIDANK